MLTSVAKQTIVQNVLLDTKEFFVVSWNPHFSTVFNVSSFDKKKIFDELTNTRIPIGKSGNLEDMAKTVSTNSRGTMVRTVIHHKKNDRKDRAFPAEFVMTIRDDTLGCASIEDDGRDALILRMLDVQSFASIGSRLADGSIVRSIRCKTHDEKCSTVVDDGTIAEYTIDLMQTPLWTICLEYAGTRVHLIDLTTSMREPCMVVVEHEGTWKMFDTLARALSETNINEASLTPRANTIQFNTRRGMSLDSTRIRLHDDGMGCSVNIFPIEESSSVHSNTFAFALDMDRELSKAMRRLKNLYEDYKTNSKAFSNWWNDLMTLLALRPGSSTVYHITIDPSLSSPAFESAAVNAAVMFHEMVHDASQPLHVSCSPTGERWKRVTDNSASNIASTDIPEVKKLLEEAWDASDVSARVLHISAPRRRYEASQCIRLVHPRTLEVALFSPVCEDPLYTVDYEFLRAIFRGKRRPVFKNTQLEKRVVEIVRSQVQHC
jgi:hypothetical protein